MIATLESTETNYSDVAPPPPCDLPLPRDCTFAEADWRVLANYWYPIAVAERVTDKPVAAKLLDQRLVIYRTSSGLTVANDICLHRGVPLSMGWLENDVLVCKYHGLNYNCAGECVKIPAHPGVTIPTRLKLHTYPVAEHCGLVWTCLSGNPANALPEVPEWDDPDYQNAMPDPIDIKCAAGRQLESFLDVAHFAWIHHETFGDRNNPVVPNYPVTRTAKGLHIEYRSTVGDYLRQDGSELNPEDGVLRVFDLTFPFSARLVVHMPGGGKLVILDSASPVSARVTRMFPPLMRNYDKDEPIQPFIDYNNKIFYEDQDIVLNQCPEDLPINLQEEVHIRADRTSIEFRKELGRMGLSCSYTT